jgi:aliphatic nitrilase
MSSEKFIAAAVQASSEYLDLEACIEKALGLIANAAARGAKIVAFPELWAPGYPWWIWLDGPAFGLSFMKRYRLNAMERNGRQMQALQDAAHRHGIIVVMGHAERAGGSLYMAQSILHPDGRPPAHRRKLKPSGTERTMFAEGDGADLQVVDSAIGRVGALCCWEHIQPLSKYALYAQAEQFHVAAWPALSFGRGMRYSTGPEMTAAINSVYALEGGCFVIAPTAVNDASVVNLLCDTEEKRRLLGVLDGVPTGGAAAIYAPDGQRIGSSLEDDQEGLVFAELDLDSIKRAKAGTDVVGHSARPDAVRLIHNRGKLDPVMTLRDELPGVDAEA